MPSFPAPPRIRAFAFSSDLSLGDSAALTCAVKRGSTGPHTFSWLRDGDPLVQGRRVSVSRPSDVMSILAFENVQPEDVANYTCVAANAHGQHSVTAALVVTGTPRTSVRHVAYDDDDDDETQFARANELSAPEVDGVPYTMNQWTL
ncbi:hypothetical protein HPB50_006453 [Hyalomma asiaticum]|uniref:Uncharacterized protein n=1 Tax=Hyalomma asiaticum TaxID=266040 RepID=A0ACB7RHZ3_HYAAI|nr:hypothetical protein HPB50_006453 [Hyalomma asiaticum]